MTMTNDKMERIKLIRKLYHDKAMSHKVALRTLAVIINEKSKC